MPVRNDFHPGEFCWIDLNAHDLESAAAWYAGLFGWKVQMMPTPEGGMPYAFLCRGEDGICGVGQMSDEMKAQGIPPLWNSYVSTADCEATEARVKELGGTITCPTMTVPGHGKMCYFLDPQGASIACWQSLNPDGPGMLVREPGSLSWNELMTRDVRAAQEFYGPLFGWSFSPMPMEGAEDYHVLKLGDGDAGGMMSMNGPQFEGVPPHWLVYFETADCDATAAQAKSSGGSIHVPPMEIPVGKFTVLQDPQGGVFCAIALNPA